MRLLDRYLFRETAAHFVAITGLLCVIYSSFLFAKVLWLAAENRFSQQVVWQLLGLTSLQNLKELAPIGLFLGILLAFGRMYHDSEMAAMQAGGVGARQWLRPVLRLAAAVAAALALLSMWISPAAITLSQEIRIKAFREARLAGLEPQRFRNFAGGLVFYAERIDEAGMLHHVFVQRRLGDRIEVTVAQRAEQQGAGEEQQTFVLYDGETYQGAPGQAAFRVARFSESRIPVQLPKQEAGAVRVDAKSTWTLLRSSDVADRAELQTRASVPLMTLILALLAVPLSRLRPRQGRYANVGLGLLVFFFYLLAVRTAGSWIQQQTISPLVGVWWVHLCALAAALWLLQRQDPLRSARAGA